MKIEDFTHYEMMPAISIEDGKFIIDIGKDTVGILCGWQDRSGYGRLELMEISRHQLLELLSKMDNGKQPGEPIETTATIEDNGDLHVPDMGLTFAIESIEDE